MKNIALAVPVVALVALTAAGPALAADLPVAVKAPAPESAAAYNWNGLYAGVSAGGRWSDTAWTTNCIIGVPGCGGTALGVHNPVSFDSATARVGGYLGYNWQVARSWLVGLEGDLAWGNSSNTVTGIPGTIAAAAALAATGDSATVKENWDGSLRARVGILVSPAWLLYATGGAAWQQIDLTASCTGVAGASQCLAGLGTSETSSTTRAGWTVGGGIEAAFWSNWFARAEYRYSDYGNISHTFFANNPSAIPFSMSELLRTHTALLGVAYKFGQP